MHIVSAVAPQIISAQLYALETEAEQVDDE
jgi:hypothetical protein